MTGPPARTAPLLLIAAAAFLAGALPLPAQSNGRVVESVLLPPRFYVGDPVELRLRLEVPAGVEVAQPSPGSLPPPGKPPSAEGAEAPRAEVSRVEVTDRRPPGRAGQVQVSVFFTSFAPGEGTLPAFECGGLRIPVQEFTTTTVRDREPEPAFRPLRGQLLLPYTRLRLMLAAVVTVGTPVGLAFLGLWGARAVRTLAELRRRRRPARRARAALGRLEQHLESAEAKELFVDLSRILKRYVAERLEVAAVSATTAEIEGLLVPAGVPEPVVLEIRDVLRTADRAKFSGMSARRSTAQSSLRRIDRIVSAVEQLEESEEGAHVES
jgi:hypothetical protein